MAKGKILVVDDTGFNRIILEKILLQEGYDVVQAGGGKEAFKKLSVSRYDIVLTDLMMPEMDGLQLFTEVKNTVFFDDRGKVPPPPFILITALQEKSMIEQAIMMGFLDVMLKPVDRERLVGVLEKAFAGKTILVPVTLTGTEAKMMEDLSGKLSVSVDDLVMMIVEEVGTSGIFNNHDTFDDISEALRKKLL